MSYPTIVMSIILILVLIWLTIGFYNYRRAMMLLEQYQAEYGRYLESEKKYHDTNMRASFFILRMDLRKAYPELDQMATLHQEDAATFKKNLIKEYLRLGPVYNVWK